MANWDVFHADRLELERGLGADAIRSALARGELRDDDLVRPAGSTIPWARLADIPELISATRPDPPPQPASAAPGKRTPVPDPVIGCRTSKKFSRALRRSSLL